MSAKIRGDFIGPPPGWCPDTDKHDGLRTSPEDLKQHLIDVHGFVYDEQNATRRKALRRTCPTEIERLTLEVQQWRSATEGLVEQRTRLEIEIERLRVFLKHLKGVAQDSDDTAVMAEIDAMLNGSWPT